MSLVLLRSDLGLAGNVSALDVEAVYEEHHDLVFRIGLRYGSGSVAWAEDLTHDVFLPLFADPGVLEGVDNVAAWLYRAATNASLNRLARERFLRSAPVRWLLVHRTPQPPDLEAMGIADERLRRAFTALARSGYEARTTRPESSIPIVTGDCWVRPSRRVVVRIPLCRGHTNSRSSSRST